MPDIRAFQAGLTPPPSDGSFTYEIVERYTLFDTQPITNAQQAVPNFFVTLSSDQTITNMPSAGQLPDGWYFDIEDVYANPLVIPAAGTKAVTGPAADLANIYNTQRATFEFKYNDKSYGVRPLSSFGPEGAVQAFTSMEGATADPGASLQVAWPGPVGAGSGYLMGLRINPKTRFIGIVSLAGAPTITQTPLNLRLSLVGRLWRKVT